MVKRLSLSFMNFRGVYKNTPLARDLYHNSTLQTTWHWSEGFILSKSAIKPFLTRSLYETLFLVLGFRTKYFRLDLAIIYHLKLQGTLRTEQHKLKRMVVEESHFTFKTPGFFWASSCPQLFSRRKEVKGGKKEGTFDRMTSLEGFEVGFTRI